MTSRKTTPSRPCDQVRPDAGPTSPAARGTTSSIASAAFAPRPRHGVDVRVEPERGRAMGRLARRRGLAVEPTGSESTIRPCRSRAGRRVHRGRAAPIGRRRARSRTAEAAVRRETRTRAKAARRSQDRRLPDRRRARSSTTALPSSSRSCREPLERRPRRLRRDPRPRGARRRAQRFFELHKLPKRGVRIGLSNNRIGVRIFEIDGVDDEQPLRERHPLPGR